MPKVYIDEFVGISNRLEALPLAFAIQEKYGHEIVLDWNELDSFDVVGTRVAKIRPWHKIGATRLRDCSFEQFQALGDANVICRSLDGPSKYLDPIYLDVGARVRPATFVADGIKKSFSKYSGRPVVGVHVRQGDYSLVDESKYSINAEWPAVPVWWYHAAMKKIKCLQPDVVFFLAHNGSQDPLQVLFDDFEVFQLELESTYDYKGDDHSSKVNPVADLFALACCPNLIATPFSGYSHWAANVMGSPSTAILPIPECTASAPRFGKLDIFGKRLTVWRNASRTGLGVEILDEDRFAVDFSKSAQIDWLNQKADRT